MRSTPRLVVATLSLILVCAAASLASASGAFFLPLGDLPGGPFHTWAFGISADGSTVVGRSKSSDADSNSHEAFRWTQSTGMVGLGDVVGGAPRSRAEDVSADGSVVAGSSGNGWPFLWTQATGMVEIEDTTGTYMSARPFGLSADGTTMVGTGRTANAGNEAFRWTAGTGYVAVGFLPSTIHDSFLTDVSADGSVATGFSFHHGTDVEPMIWTAAGLDSLGDVPGGDPYALAWGISADGTTVVGDAHIDGTSEPWLWSAKTGFVLPDSTHDAGWFNAVSADGSVAVGSVGLIWDAVNGMRDLTIVLADEGIDITGWSITSISDVSADGRTMTGYGFNPSGDVEGWIAHLPDAVTAAPGPAAHPRPALALTSRGANPSPGAQTFDLELAWAGRVRAQVFGLDGRLLRTLVDAPLSAGTHALLWDGRDDRGLLAATGIYFVRATAGGEAVTRKVVRLK
jgi:probable HAF family extracellular repeat protein